MLNYLQASILGIVQGIAEPFPVSSLGHSVIVPRLFGWAINQNDPFFLTFLVATHAATALVFFIIFWKEWKKIILGVLRSLRHWTIPAGDTYAKLGWLLIVGTVPAAILGLVLQKKLEVIFASAQYATFFLMLNGILLYGAEMLRRHMPQSAIAESEKDSDKNIVRQVGWKQTLYVGTAQALALIPGFSRSGASMGGGLLVGLNNEEAARFSFLLATPVIGAAAVLKLPSLFSSSNHGQLGVAVVGALFAAVTSWLAVKFLLRFFTSNRLTSFAVYCFLAGALASIYFLIK